MSYWAWSPLLTGAAVLNGTHQVYASDTCAVQTDLETWRKLQRTYVDLSAVDQTHWHVFDELPIHLTPEAALTPTPIGATDSCAYVSSDATPFIASTLSLSDAIAIGFSSELPAILITLSVTDTCAVLASELAAVLNAFSVTDTCAAQASEASPVVVAVLSVSDACVIQANEGSPSIVSSVSATETALIQAAESVRIDSTVAMADSAGVTGSDVAAILVAGTVTDSLSLTLTEAPAITVATSMTDSCAVIASEATANVVQNTLVSATDACAMQASEATPLIGQVFNVTDSCAVVASDVNVGPHMATAQDDLAIQTAEATANSLSMVASETMALLSDEQGHVFFAVTVTDGVALTIADVGSQQIVGAVTPISASDSCHLGLDDQLLPPRSLFVEDTCPLPLDEMSASPAIPAEEVALLLLEEVRLEITPLETYWGGGVPWEEARDLYASSYRMGPRNADETRGTEY